MDSNVDTLQCAKHGDILDAGKSLEYQVQRALRVMAPYDGIPVVYGTFGFSNSEEVSVTGLSRGVPTLPQGHIHIAKMHEASQDIGLKDDVPYSAQIHHFGVWSRLVNRKFGPDLAEILRCSLQDSLISESLSNVTFLEKESHHMHGRVSSHQGYEVKLRESVPFFEVFTSLVESTGRIEKFYQFVVASHTQYYRNVGNRDFQQKTFNELQKKALEAGIGEDRVEEFAKFVFDISPTYGQLSNWVEDSGDSLSESGRQFAENRIAQMKRVHDFLECSNDWRLSSALMLDSLREADQFRDHTWPAKFSAYYLFDSFVESEDGLLVNGFTILPANINKTGIPERFLGVRLSRDVGMRVK